MVVYVDPLGSVDLGVPRSPAEQELFIGVSSLNPQPFSFQLIEEGLEEWSHHLRRATARFKGSFL